MTFDEAVEIYTNTLKERGHDAIMQPGVLDSYLSNGVWYLRNVNGHLAKVGTKCQCLIETQPE